MQFHITGADSFAYFNQPAYNTVTHSEYRHIQTVVRAAFRSSLLKAMPIGCHEQGLFLSGPWPSFYRVVVTGDFGTQRVGVFLPSGNAQSDIQNV